MYGFVPMMLPMLSRSWLEKVFGCDLLPGAVQLIAWPGPSKARYGTHVYIYPQSLGKLENSKLKLTKPSNGSGPSVTDGASAYWAET